ncbi:MAG: MFS transporter [Clostridia bacterium]|nr:MFS transporter [Clostridia bacterium]
MTEEKFSSKQWLILILFGAIGQIAWSVENMYFNLFVFDEISKNLDAITLMVQLSGVVATVVTLLAGTLSDKSGNRRRFISIGYIIWGVTVALFGFISPELVGKIFNTGEGKAIQIALIAVIVGDCVMTLFGSTANDAAFNAWVTDNTNRHNRGTVEGILSILPLIAMLIVAGGFGMLVTAIGYPILFLALGIVISACGVVGVFVIKDSPSLSKSGSMRDIFYGFSPKVVKQNPAFYLTLLIILIYGIACQVFMPYLIIYMREYLGFSVFEYSAVFAIAIILGAAVNLYLTRLSDKYDKAKLMYVAAPILAVGLLAMYFSRDMAKGATLALFGIAGFVMICGYIFVSALSNSTLRDATPTEAVGKLQGVRMVFSVLIPMIAGPAIGNAINSVRNIPIAEDSADAMTTAYMPAPEIFLVAAIITLLMLAVVPFLSRSMGKSSEKK